MARVIGLDVVFFFGDGITAKIKRVKYLGILFYTKAVRATFPLMARKSELTTPQVLYSTVTRRKKLILHRGVEASEIIKYAMKGGGTAGIRPPRKWNGKEEAVGLAKERSCL